LTDAWWQNCELTHRDQTSTSNSSQTPHRIKKEYVRSNGTAKTTNDERDSGESETCSSAKHIGEATVQWLESRARDEIRSRQPRSTVGRIEI